MRQAKIEQNLTDFGKRVEHLRTITGQTTTQIAKELDLSRTMLHYLVVGTHEPGGNTLYRLREAEQRAGLRKPGDTSMGEIARTGRTVPELHQHLDQLRRILTGQLEFAAQAQAHAREIETWVAETEAELKARGEKFLAVDVARNVAPARKEKRARRPAGSLTDVAAVSVGLFECPAGGPLSPAHRIGEVRVDPGRWDAADLFALRLVGDSMDRASLGSGDLVLCVWAERREPAAGDIVVAHLLGDGCTLKRLHGPEGARWLEPESTNPVHERIALDGEGEPQAVIQAVMLRKL